MVPLGFFLDFLAVSDVVSVESVIAECADTLTWAPTLRWRS
jgi:hypothetical protein